MSDQNQWYKDAIIYQLHIKAFNDSDGDGIGDFKGLTQKLDYIQDLGVTAIWVLPFYPSPLKDDGYDIADYTEVHPSYGTLKDFRNFLRQAHKRDLKVITELVINHTSDQHPWFQRARRAEPGSRHRDFYVWSNTPDRYTEARIIFQDYEHSNWAWDPVAEAYYWHRFYSHQPDLNFENPGVRRAIFDALDFWMEMGVDGMRLDAVPYLYEREGTDCENLPETHAFLKEMRAHVDKHYPGRMLLAEANQWPEDAVAYFGDGDEAHMAFHFPVMPRLYMAVHMEDRYPIVEILEQTPEIPESSQWAIFLRNHDELTLEMVTDEDRDYMYRVYAQDPQARLNLGIRRRLAPLMGNNQRRIELLNSLLMSLPGTPVIYYGDEIGMGDNIYVGDRNGVRTPMQWSPDRNAGFSRANPQQLYLPVILDQEYHYEAVNVEVQQNNPSSLLWWMKRLLAVRKRFTAFSRGEIEFLQPDNRRVLVFLRKWQDEHLLVVVNLSRFVQAVELDLSTYKDFVPTEVFGQTPFPRIGDLPYFLTLGPHSFYWFSLEPVRERDQALVSKEPELATLRVGESWEKVFENKARARLEKLLPGHLRSRRWFAGKARRILSSELLDAVRLEFEGTVMYLVLVQVNYREGNPDIYQMHLGYAQGARAQELLDHNRGVVIAELHVDGEEEQTTSMLYDVVIEPAVARGLLDLVGSRRRPSGERGALRSARTRHFKRLLGEEPPASRVLSAEQSNTSIAFGDRLMMKLIRRLDLGPNPDLEIGHFLTERAKFQHTPELAGSLAYERSDGESMTLAVLHAFRINQGDAWDYTLDSLDGFLEHVLAQPVEARESPSIEGNVLDHIGAETPAMARDLFGGYLEFAELLGRRTAELHIALSSDPDSDAFAPQPINAMYRRSLYQSSRTRLDQAMSLLKKHLAAVPADTYSDATWVLDSAKSIDRRLRAVVEKKIQGQRIRCHGDFHLGQVLYTGKDLLILDFEGEPARPISERRLKRPPLTDVAGMLRSFDYASVSAVIAGRARPEDLPVLEPWTQYWYLWVSNAFLRSYRETAAESAFLPRSDDQFTALLDVFLFDKALYELAYELNNRPGWVQIPLRGLIRLLEGAQAVDGLDSQ